MRMKLKIPTILFMVSLSFFTKTYAEETFSEKAETTKNKAVDSVKSTYRKIDEKVCEKVNGKLSCISKKAKNKLKNTSDKLKTDTNDVINKID